MFKLTPELWIIIRKKKDFPKAGNHWMYGWYSYLARSILPDWWKDWFPFLFSFALFSLPSSHSNCTFIVELTTKLTFPSLSGSCKYQNCRYFCTYLFFSVFSLLSEISELNCFVFIKTCSTPTLQMKCSFSHRGLLQRSNFVSACASQ